VIAQAVSDSPASCHLMCVASVGFLFIVSEMIPSVTSFVFVNLWPRT